MSAPETCTGLHLPERDLRATCGMAPPAHCQLSPVGAESQAPDMVLGAAKAQPPLASSTLPKFHIRTALTDGERPAGAGSKLASVGAEGNRADASGGRVHGQALGVTKPHDVVPFPAAALDGAPVEQVLGERHVIVLHLPIGPVDPV